MVMEKAQLSKNERIAYDVMGMESDGKQFAMNEDFETNKVKDEVIDSFNNLVDKYIDKFERHNELLNQYAKDITEDLNGVEIMPLGSYVLVKPFKINPFQKEIRKNGVITDTGGLVPEYKSNETGEIEEEDNFMRVATVIETGPKCEFLIPGDIVIYTKASEAMIPYFKFGFMVVDEHRVMSVINEKLTERKNNYGNIPR